MLELKPIKERIKEAEKQKDNQYFMEQLKNNPDAHLVLDGNELEAVGDGCDYENGIEFLNHRLEVNGWSFDKMIKSGELSFDDLLNYLEFDPKEVIKYLADGYEDKVDDFVKDQYGA